MMTQANVDYLFQLTAPSPDRAASGAPQPGDRTAAFDEHLFQASETSRDASPKQELIPRLTGNAHADGHQRSSTPEFQHAPTASAETQPADCATCGDAETHPGETTAESAAPEEHGDAQVAGAVVNQADESTHAPADTDENEPAEEATDEAKGNTVALADAPQALIVNTAIAIEASLALPDGNPTDATLEAGAREAPITPHAPTDKHEANQPPSGSTTTSPVAPKPEAAAKPSINIDAKFDLEQQAPDPEQTTAVGAALVAGSEQPLALSDQTNDRKTANGSRDEKTAKRQARSTDKPDAQEPTIDETVKPASVARPKAEKVAAAGRRTSEKGKSTESRPSDGPQFDARTENGAAPNRPVVTTAENPLATSPTVSPPPADATKDASSTSPKPAGPRSDAVLQSLGRSQRPGAPLGRTGQASAAEHMPRIDSARFVGRVAKAVQTAHERGGALQLRLSPPELGSLRLELWVQNGVMTAALEAESPAARQVLLDHLPALRDRLAEQNIRIERFDVDVRQDGLGNQADPRASQHEQRQRPPYDPPPRQAANRTPSTDTEQRSTAPMSPRQTTSGINILA